MTIAQDIKSLADKILADYDARIVFLGGVISDTEEILKNARDTVKGFAPEREKMGAQLKKDLRSYVGDIKSTTGKLLKDFGKAHKDMAASQAENLSKTIKNLVNETKSLLGEYRKDISGAREAWQNMAAKMAKSRQEEAETVESAAEGEGGEAKPKKRGRKRSRRKK